MSPRRPKSLLEFQSHRFSPSFCRKSVADMTASLTNLLTLIDTGFPTTNRGMTAAACWQSKLAGSITALECLVHKLGPTTVIWPDGAKFVLVSNLKASVEVYAEVLSQILENYTDLDENRTPSARHAIDRLPSEEFTLTERNQLDMFVQLRNHSCHTPTGYLQSECGHHLCQKCGDLKVLIHAMWSQAMKTPNTTEYGVLKKLLDVKDGGTWKHEKVYHAIWNSPELYPALGQAGLMEATTNALRKAFITYGFPELVSATVSTQSSSSSSKPSQA